MNIFSSKAIKKSTVLLGLFVVIHFNSNGQGCNCPPIASCGPCDSGFTSITLRYNGPGAVTIVATDAGGLLYTGLLVNTGQIITLEGSLANGKFNGNTLSLYVNLAHNFTLNTNCSTPVIINQPLGSFTVVAAESFMGGPLCCAPGDFDSTDPVITGCPSDILVPNDAGACTAAVSWTVPTANDNCGAVSLTSTHSPGFVFPVGSTEVIYTATDDYGNISTCSFDVVVADESDPVISGCLADITISADGSCEAIAIWTEPTASDNCAVETFVSSHSSGATFPKGTTLVSYTATDAAGNTSTCTFNVIVNDDTDPLIDGCPVADINAVADVSCQATVSWTAPTATDNCGLVTLVSSHEPGDIFPIGTTTVVYTATDESGNSSICTFDVVVEDDTDPVITGCPATDILAVTDASCQAVVTWTAPITSDNCAIASWVSSHDPGDTFDKGTTVVTYTATDAAGNISTCQFNVIVTDETFPVFVACPPSEILATANALCQATVGWGAPAASDNCGPITPTSNYSPGDIFPIGTTQVIYTAEDAAGNISTCEFNVVVQDVADPVIAGCPAADVMASADASCQAVVDWTAPTVSENCSLTSFTSTHDPGDIFPIGTTVVLYTATDASGNIATCAFNVVVNDDTDPLISGCNSSDIVVSANSQCEGTATWGEPVATDNCGSVNMIRSHIPGSTFPLGTTVVTYTATDGFGNVSTCVFNVVVEDTTLPEFVGCVAGDIVVVADASCVATATWTAPTATDNCGATLTSTHDPGDTFSFGTTQVKYTATDASGNTSMCTFNVMVEDQTPPVFSGCFPSDLEFFANESCQAIATWTAPTAADNCSAPDVVSTHSSGSIFPLGRTTVTYTATDDSGNSSTCAFDVVIIDNSPPTISSCNTSDILAVANGSCGSAVHWAVPTATDNCSTPTLESSHDPGDIFPLGTTVVTYTATDLAGNVQTCAFNVIVKDETAPLISGCVVNDIFVSANSSCEGTASWAPPIATDNCSVEPLTTTHEPGSTFPLGTTIVTYTATDASGNIAQCTFNVIVADDIDPEISGCPGADILLPANGTCQAVASWSEPLASDNCPGVTMESSHISGDAFPQGTTLVVYTATDASGNTTTCSFNVIVTDTADPVISGCFSTDVTALATTSCQTAVSWTEPIASDNCSTVSTMSSHHPGDVFPLGRTTVTYSATDASGNTSNCAFDVVVSDGAPPVFAPCPDIIVAAGQGCETIATWPVPTVTDCSPITLDATHSSGDLFPKGVTNVTYTATDSYGNISSCTFKVIVEDNMPPVFQNCVNDMVVNAGAQCEAVVNWIAPAVSDNCGVPAIESTHTPGSTFPLGTTKIIYTGTDESGNTAACEFTVTVRNETTPTFENCPDDIQLTANEFGQAVGEWSSPGATSVCGEVTVTRSHVSGDIFSLGSTTVEYQAADISGNISRCRFNVIVVKPEIDIGISQVVTPDGNGINDEWVLTNIEKFVDNTLVIVDRWGSIIYTATGYNNGSIVWKGIGQNGNAVPTGTYFYRLTVRYGPDFIERTGFVELIR